MSPVAETLERLEKELAVHKKMVEILQSSIKEVQATKKLGTGATGVKRRGRPPGSKNKNNEFPLTEVLSNIFAKTKSGMNLPGLVTKVIEAGYKSSSKDLTKNVYAALGSLLKTKKIIKDSNKNYKAA